MLEIILGAIGFGFALVFFALIAAAILATLYLVLLPFMLLFIDEEVKEGLLMLIGSPILISIIWLLIGIITWVCNFLTGGHVLAGMGA